MPRVKKKKQNKKAPCKEGSNLSPHFKIIDFFPQTPIAV